MIPSDPVMLLSFVNLKLRDYYKSLADLCEDLDVEEEVIVNKLKGIDYQYDAGYSSHLNYRGNQKLYTFIGNYLVVNCINKMGTISTFYICL